MAGNTGAKSTDRAKLAAAKGKGTKPGESMTADDVSVADEIGIPEANPSPIQEEGGQVKVGPTTEQAAKGSHGEENTSAARAKLLKDKLEEVPVEEPTFKPVFVVNLGGFQVAQHVDHPSARSDLYIIRPIESEPQRAFDDEWLRMNIASGLLALYTE